MRRHRPKLEECVVVFIIDITGSAIFQSTIYPSLVPFLEGRTSPARVSVFSPARGEENRRAPFLATDQAQSIRLPSVILPFSSEASILR